MMGYFSWSLKIYPYIIVSQLHRNLLPQATTNADHDGSQLYTTYGF